jgi:hypothetical protein
VATVEIIRPYIDYEGHKYGEELKINGEEWNIGWDGNIFKGHYKNNLDRPDRFFGFVNVKDKDDKDDTILQAGYQLILDYLQHPNNYLEKSYSKLRLWFFNTLFNDIGSNRTLHDNYSYVFFMMIHDGELNPQDYGKNITNVINRIRTKTGTKKDMVYWLSQVRVR